MYIVNMSQDVEEGKQLLLLEHLVSMSDKASVSRYYNGYIESGDFLSMQAEYKEKLTQRARKRRLDYKDNVNGFKDRIDSMYKTNERVMDYFEDLEEQEIEVYESVTTDGNSESIEKLDITGIISSCFTRTTHVTEGPVQQIIYLEVGAAQEHVVNQLNGIYDFPYEIHGLEFEDLALYKDDSVLFAICSHERFAHIFLDENEAKQIVNMGFINKDALLEV